VRRVVRVACGLESVVEGEDEILGQVRRAWLDAGAAGALPPTLDAAFHLAVRTGRQARRTGDPHAWTSLTDSAAARAAAAIEHLPAPRVLVAGTGPMGLRAARTLRERLGLGLELTLAGRTPARAALRAAELGARPLDLVGVPAALAWADAAIVALRTTRAMFTADAIAAHTGDRPLVLIDLSVPRAVDEAVARLPGVRMLNVDDVGAGEGTFTRWDTRGRERVETLVARAVADFSALRERGDAAGTLTALRVRAEGIRRRQLTQTLRRLPDLDDQARWAIEALSHAIVNKLLHEPTMRLKSDPNGGTARQVQELFGMGDAGRAPS
jgi:glutamyl-tRNA reductase